MLKLLSHQTLTDPLVECLQGLRISLDIWSQPNPGHKLVELTSTQELLWKPSETNEVKRFSTHLSIAQYGSVRSVECTVRSIVSESFGLEGPAVDSSTQSVNTRPVDSRPEETQASHIVSGPPRLTLEPRPFV